MGVNTADLAVIAVTVVGLANVAKDYRVQMRVADRMRLVGPVKPPAPDKAAVAASKPVTSEPPVRSIAS